MFYIYKIKVGSKSYFGRTNDYKKRISDHKSKLNRGKHSNPILQNAFSKYGTFESFNLLRCEVLETSIFYEQLFIDNTSNVNINNAQKGSKIGTKRPVHTCKRISEALKGKKKSDTHKENISNSLKGKTHSSEAKSKMSKRKLGELNNNFDSTLYHFAHTNNMIEICTKHHLYKKYNLLPTCVTALVKGRRKTHKGWTVIK